MTTGINGNSWLRAWVNNRIGRHKPSSAGMKPAFPGVAGGVRCSRNVFAPWAPHCSNRVHSSQAANAVALLAWESAFYERS